MLTSVQSWPMQIQHCKKSQCNSIAAKLKPTNFTSGGESSQADQDYASNFSGQVRAKETTVNSRSGADSPTLVEDSHSPLEGVKYSCNSSRIVSSMAFKAQRSAVTQNASDSSVHLPDFRRSRERRGARRVYKVFVTNSEASPIQALSSWKVKHTVRVKVDSFDVPYCVGKLCKIMTIRRLPRGIRLQKKTARLLHGNQLFLSFWADEKSNGVTYTKILRHIRIKFFD